MTTQVFDSLGKFMQTPPIGTRLKWLGVSKSFFTKARTKCRIKRYRETMWDVRSKKIVDPNTWNEAVLVYGLLPLWNETNQSINPEIQVGEDIK